MPPKIKVSKEDIVKSATDIVRKSGADSLNAREIASKLNCSTQPVFSNFATMDDLKFAVVEKAYKMYSDYINREIHKGEFPPYKASGMAYIRFAREEKELFKLLFMRDRTNEVIPESDETNNQVEYILQNNTGLSQADVKLFHLEMWAYVHGIATMVATNFENIEWELISRMLSDAYQGLRKQYGTE